MFSDSACFSCLSIFSPVLNNVILVYMVSGSLQSKTLKNYVFGYDNLKNRDSVSYNDNV